MTLECDHGYMLEQLGSNLNYSLYYADQLLKMYLRVGDREREAKILLLLARVKQANELLKELS